MDNITLGQIKDIVIWFSVIAGAIGSLYALLMKGIGKLLQPIQDNLQDERKERIKSDLTTFMYMAERDTLSDGQKMRLYEEYDDYIKSGGNSYIKEEFERLKKEGKI